MARRCAGAEGQHRPQHRPLRRHQLSAELRPLAENSRKRDGRRLPDMGVPGKKIGDAGLWMKGMPNVAYHPEIGHMPVWHNRALYSGDWRMREIMLGQADLVGAFPVQRREGDPNKRADRAQTVPATGLPVTVYARPRSWLLDPRDPAPLADK